MATSLVTGGAGFIGSHVAACLLERGHDVVILDDLSGGFQENVPPDAEFVEGSILDHELVEQLFETNHFDYVYHFAAYAAEGLSHFIKRFNYTNNLVGAVNLIDSSVNYRVKRFVFASSIAVYGTAATPWIENAQPIPDDPYGIAKFACEQELRSTQRMFGLDFTIFRLHNVYGPKQNIGDRYRNVIGIFMNQILRGEPLTIFGDGSQRRAFTYIDDIAPIIAGCVDTAGTVNEAFNVGSDALWTISELAAAVSAAMGGDAEVRHLASRREAHVAHADHRKAMSVFGEWRQTPLHDGLMAMSQWARCHGLRECSRFEHVEIARGLPEGWQIGAHEAHYRPCALACDVDA